MWNRRARWAVVGSLTAAALLLSQILLYALSKVLHSPVLTNLFDMCNSWLMRLRLPVLALLLDALVLSTVAAGFWLVLSQTMALIRFRFRLTRSRNRGLSRQLANKYGLAEGQVAVVTSREPLALTVGFIRPVIVMSTRMLELLDEDERHAVIRHEQFHLQSRDPLRSLLILMLARMMWYLPILRWCHRCVTVWREIRADQYAIEKVGSAAGLGGALIKLVKYRPAQMSLAHASFADTPINVRIRQLIDPDDLPRVRLPWASSLISLHVLAFLTALLTPAYW